MQTLKFGTDAVVVTVFVTASAATDDVQMLVSRPTLRLFAVKVSHVMGA